MATTLGTLSTHVEPKRRKKKKGPLFFKTRKRTSIRQGKPQPHSKIPITIDESLGKKEEMRPIEGKNEEVTSPKEKTKQHMMPMGWPTTREVTLRD